VAVNDDGIQQQQQQQKRRKEKRAENQKKVGWRRLIKRFRRKREGESKKQHIFSQNRDY
jgi:predicted RNase H-like nuclease (RuvC/YqgF family)